MQLFSKKFSVLAASSAALMAMLSMPASATTVTYNLTQKSTLTNVDDSEGRWQFDGGEVYLGTTKVGYYTRKKRVSFGIPASINKSSMEITVIWGTGDYNFTAQGSHYFSTGYEVGGISATTPGFTVFNNATFTGGPTSLTITY